MLQENYEKSNTYGVLAAKLTREKHQWTAALALEKVSNRIKMRSDALMKSLEKIFAAAD